MQRFVPPVPLNHDAQIVSHERLELNISSKKGDSSSIFSFSVARHSDAVPLWDTSIGGLLFAKIYFKKILKNLKVNNKIYRNKVLQNFINYCKNI